ncbi:penicillin-binding protein [Weissella diestrammenae]|uniref:Penicillin-binding protein n=1 Tax=Weissella diestrammenae TaxID=1162633 RepID=A0A7G9T6E7_9LACO|nr:penicillin-binding transpeptidase domain-containing protein [Weissella diestrammenae]MCM0583281.1 penicillin-binding protein [Weissella diestrammenae]QNN75672.1 penicillin-binding protein [Weissella diestrammenae]
MTKKMMWIIGASVAMALVLIAGVTYYVTMQSDTGKARQVGQQYLQNLKKLDYKQMFQAVDKTSLKTTQRKHPDQRMKTVYQQLGVTKVDVIKSSLHKTGLNQYEMQYQVTLKTAIGKLTHQVYRMKIKMINGQAKIQYAPSLILPDLTATNTVHVAKNGGERGQILDRNGQVLAGSEETKVLQIVPKYFLTDDGQIDSDKVNEIAKKYNASADTINQGIQAYKAHSDWGYPVKTLTADDYQKDDDGDGASVVANYKRTYPLGAAAAQLIGYTGTVTKEDIDKNALLSSQDIIGRAGLELRLDQQLRGQESIQYQLLDSKGQVEKTLLSQKFKKGQDIKLTIDAEVQKNAYEGFNNVPGAAVIENPGTGELLALASSPSYDPNTLSENYASVANNADAPFIARYAKGYAPASTFKQVTAAIGLDQGTLDPNEVLTIEGKKWDAYSVTRVNSDTQVNLQTALSHSDNIYFAKQALKIGRDKFQKALQEKFTFGTKYQLPITMTPPSFSNDGQLKTDKQLADTAYGQGQMSVNPIQMVTMYNFIDNDGTIVMPKLLMSDKTKKIENVVQADHAKTILNDEIGVVANADGYAHQLYAENYKLAAKTGTAETGNGNQNALVSVHDAQNKKFSALFIVENSVLNGQEHNPTADKVAKQAISYLENH